ncbi:translocation/assembly module TamB domain-containing protein [Thermosynechococcus vestitus]|uniref:Tll2375 protein n=1 Tax=Thermosynechococcus vestitus (strain NIES-2133 / IAM M-273 / BP-1) TaxID=197221 RepID=Q8DGE2_THEVB|nr:translocation/assembly module TamB domain-containing protein [Thermosynechococcus vestitus]BAC09927.1 tll2375 [Thermosynechococcus vestitus BP-1]
MTQQPQPPSTLRLGQWGWRMIGLVALGAIAVGTRTWWFVRYELAPEIAQQLQQRLNRPVEIGSVEDVGLNVVRFGSSAVPSYTPEEGSPELDHALINSIEVAFNPWQLLTGQKLDIDLTLHQPQLTVVQDAQGRWWRTEVKPPEEDPTFLQLHQISVRVRDGSVLVQPFQRPAYLLRQIEGEWTLTPDRQNFALAGQLEGQLAGGGQWRLQGDWNPSQEKGQLDLRFRKIPLALGNEILPKTIRVQGGQLEGHLRVRLPLPETPQVTGQIWLRDGSLRTTFVPQDIKALQAHVQLQGHQAKLHYLRGAIANVRWQAVGTVSPERGWNINAQVSSFDLVPALRALQMTPPVALRGQVEVPTLRLQGHLENPQIVGELRSQTPLQVDQLQLQQVRLPFMASLDGGVRLMDVRAQLMEGGELRATVGVQPTGEFRGQAQVQQVNLQAIARRYDVVPPVSLGEGFAQLDFRGNWRTPEAWQANAIFQLPTAEYPLRGTARLTPTQLLVPEFQMQVLGGSVRGQGQAAAGQWQLQAQVENMPLRQLNPDLQGRLRGEAIAQGRVDQLTLPAIRARANLTVDQTPTGDPLVATVNWDGQQLQVQQATLGAIRAQGTIGVDLAALKPTDIQLGIQARNLSLSRLSTVLKPKLPVALAGTTSFEGQLTGRLNRLQFQGTLLTQGLALNDLRFAPQLTGTVALSQQQGATLNLQGGGDRVAFRLDADGLLHSLLVQRQQAQLIGQRQGEIFDLRLQQFPVESLRLGFPELPRGVILAGVASGELQWQNWTSGQGSLTVERPGLGAWRGDRLQGQFRLRGDRLTIQSGLFEKGQSRYHFTADLQPQQLGAQLTIAQGNLADLTGLATVLGIAQPPARGTAADLGTPTAGEGLPVSLLTQIRRLAEIDMLQSQAALVRRPELLPPLDQLQGIFNGQINLSQTPQSGPVVSFDLKGTNWQWGNYQVEQFLSRGRFAQNRLVLTTLSMLINGGQLNVNGIFGGNQQNAQLRLEQFPMSLVASLLPPGVDVQGKVRAQAVLTGSWQQPILTGEATLAAGRFNQRPLEVANATFRYAQNRLALQAIARLDTSEPLRVTGSVPLIYPLDPQPVVDPQLALDVSVKDDGLSFINLLTDQVQWQQGKGLFQAQLRGTWDAPIVNGVLSLDDAVIKTPAFAEPVTNLSARVRFDRDRLRVDSIQGLFSQGQITMTGVLPIQTPLAAADPDAATPLTASLRRLQVNAGNIYRGTVDGTLVITDTLLSPDLGGSVQLSQGRLDLGAINGFANGNGLATAADSLFEPLVFGNLEINILDALRVTRSPVLNLTATGRLTLNGGLDNLQPDGKIRLTGGQLNLFTTLFVLQRQADNYVLFTPANGLDPELNLTLGATATEVYTPGTVTRLSDVGSVTATRLGTLNTIRITARINGRASQLQTNLPAVLDLSSTPSRSTTELLALMGGGSIADLNQVRGEAVVASLAGSALFNNLQALIDQATGNRTSFRMFPAVVPPDRQAQSQALTLALGAELGFQVNRFTSVSLLQLLTAPNDPTRFNLGFQVTEQIRLGGQVSTSGQGTGFLEFRYRF